MAAYTITFTKSNLSWEEQSYTVSCRNNADNKEASIIFDGGVESWKLLQEAIHETSESLVTDLIQTNIDNGSPGVALTSDEFKIIEELHALSDVNSLLSSLNGISDMLTGKDNNEIYYIQTRILNYIKYYNIYERIQQKLLDNFTILFNKNGSPIQTWLWNSDDTNRYCTTCSFFI